MTRSNVSGAAHHTYTPPKPSYLTRYVVFPFYDFIVQFYPYCWTPNGITLFGIFCTTLASLLLFTSMPNTTNFVDASLAGSRWRSLLAPFSSPSDAISRGTSIADPLSVQSLQTGTAATELLPSWWRAEFTLILAGVLNLLYCIADNTDGRQARRTKRSTFIGEYLDHGLDCVTSLMSTFLLAVALGVSVPLACVGVLTVAFTTVLSHTVNHELGVMIWGNDFVTVDEAMIAFGVGLWIPIIFPEAPTAAISASAAGYLPELLASAVVGVRYVDIIFVVFVLSQAQVIADMIRMRQGILFRGATWFMLFNLVFFFFTVPHPFYTSGYFSKTLPSGTFLLVPLVERFLSYPAIWAITTACTCSTICHIPIVAKCAGMRECEMGPIGIVVLVWLAFWGNPVYGLLVAVAGHATQVLLNVHHVQVTKERRVSST